MNAYFSINLKYISLDIINNFKFIFLDFTIVFNYIMSFTMFHGIVVFVPLYLFFFVQFSNTVLLQSKFVML